MGLKFWPNKGGRGDFFIAKSKYEGKIFENWGKILNFGLGKRGDSEILDKETTWPNNHHT